MALSQLRQWCPIKLDALGIITLLGPNNLRQLVGRLVHCEYAEYMPLMAAQVVADDSICDPVPGFVLYNITDKIKAADLSAWFARWLLSQDLTYCNTTLLPRVIQARPWPTLRAPVLVITSTAINICPIILASLISDWYGLACTSSVALTVMVRVTRIHALRNTLDQQAVQSTSLASGTVKVFVTLPNGKSVTVLADRGVVLGCLLTDIKPANLQFQLFLRGLLWLAFSITIITLGMACLFIQIVVVAWLLLPSLMVLGRFGCNEAVISSRLRINRRDESGINARAKCYATLNLTDEDEQAMVDWHLFPLRSNNVWWNNYWRCRDEFRNNTRAFEKWPDKVANGSAVSRAMI